MSKHHLKRLAAPKTWNINRKGVKFVTKQSAGPHSHDRSMPLNTLLKEVFGYTTTIKEFKKIFNAKNIKVDGKFINNHRFPVGVFDAIEFANITEQFRVILNEKGKIDLTKISKDEASIKPCKIIGKTMVRGKLQLNLFDGKNIFVDEDGYKVGDTIILSLPEQKIVKHLKLDKKSTIFLIGGKHIGEIGNVENVIKDKVIYKNFKGDLIETFKKYAFVVGDNKPMIKLNKDEPNEKYKS